MIVLTTEEKDLFLDYLKGFNDELLNQGLQLRPVPFKNGWMLPDSVSEDKRCACILDKLNAYQKREVAASEFKVYETVKK